MSLPDSPMAVVIQGNTFPHKELIKAMEFTWNAPHKLWVKLPDRRGNQDLDDTELIRIRRLIGCVDVEVRRVRAAYLEEDHLRVPVDDWDE